MTAPTFCTILARNYLPKALALNASLQKFGNEKPLVVFLIDATPQTELPEIDGVRWMCPAELDVPEPTVRDLVMSYDLVEFATAIKPPLFRQLLRESEQVIYLDPDTYVTSPMLELLPALAASEGGILLTPHYLEPTPPGAGFTEGHLLHVGVYNCGFFAVDRRADAFLTWWWGHLQTECLHDPIGGLFVDQKWVDVGSVLFHAAPLRHYGYNVSVSNLHERPIATDADGYYVASSGDRLRLFHFHAFDPRRPEELSTRFDASTAHLRESSEALDTLCREYAGLVLDNERFLGPQPGYIYNTDTAGRPITRRMRHAYRVAAQAAPGGIPSPFAAAEAAQWERWRRANWRLVAKLMASDLAKGVRCAWPEEYGTLKKKLPGLTQKLRGKYVEDAGMWG